MNRPGTSPRRGARLIALAGAAMGMLLVTPGAWRHRHAPALIARAAGLTGPQGLRWLTPDGWAAAPSRPAPARAVLLVHGLDEPGPIWDRLAPALADAGHAVVRFDYPNDQPAAVSAGLLRAALAELHARGVAEVPIVAHSMGGLLARDALTRPGPGLPRTPVLVTLGTPFGGSPFSAFQPLAEAREHAQRYLASGDRDPARLLAGLHDGRGEARHDLAPDSAYLTELMARPWPPRTPPRTPPGAAPIRLVCIAAVIAGDPADPGPFAARLGDGVVPLDSAIAPDADEALRVQANHRSMVRPIEAADWLRAALGLPPGPTPPAVPLVLERVGAEGTRH